MARETQEPEGVRVTLDRSRARVRAVRRAGEALLRGRSVAAVRTARGEVRISKITSGETSEIAYVEVTLAGETAGGDPHFRIFNPPTLVRDPAGIVVHGGARYREDPIAAIAEVIANLGGLSSSRKGRRV